MRIIRLATSDHMHRGVLGFALVLIASAAHGFTQSGVGLDTVGNAVPMGHEWITRIGAFEVIGGDPLQKQLDDPNDPRKHWTKGLAKNPKLDAAAEAYVKKLKVSPVIGDDTRYKATYMFIYSAIVGERWVDIGGFNVTTSTSNPFGKYDCWDAAAQEPADLQQDHFMRRYDDNEGKGGVEAATRAQKRFADHFVAAATAVEQDMTVWDGGGYAARVRVHSNFFLFGRAAHLFQDAFSSEHTVRTETPDNFERVRQVKSYLCATGAEQHTHAKQAIFNYSSGDVIWLPGTNLDVGWGGYKASHMKNVALVATEANRDLWAAFLRTMAVAADQRRARATQEAQTLIDNWLAFDSEEMTHWYDNEANRIENYVLSPSQTGKGQTQRACMIGLGVASGSQQEKVDELVAAQRACVFNVQPTPGYADLNDPHLHMPFNWEWKSATTWLTPPDDWQLPPLKADTGAQVVIRTVQSKQLPMVATQGLASGSLIQIKAGAPLRFVMVGGSDERYFFRARDNSSLMLSYVLNGGAVQLYDAWVDVSREAAGFWAADRATCKTQQWAIQNARWKDFMWVDNGGQVYITNAGNPKNPNALWLIDGLSANPPASPVPTCAKE
jgi:hypothetical protein